MAKENIAAARMAMDIRRLAGVRAAISTANVHRPRSTTG